MGKTVIVIRTLVFLLGLFLLLVLSPFIAHAVTTEVVYASDFATDPGWQTDQPDNFHWDAENEALFARTYNRPDPTYSPSRYYYTETTLNPKLSYELTWDIQIKTFGPADLPDSGVALFGLYGDRLNSFNPLNVTFPGNDQDGTFTTRFMVIDGAAEILYTEVNPGYNYDIGTEHHQNFDIGVWYSVTERYDALTRTYHFTVRDRETDALLFETAITADPQESVNPALQNLGISMHPEGVGSTQLAYGSRINGFTEYFIDNVTLTQIYDETYAEPSSVLFLPGIQASRLYTEGLFGTEDRIWEPNGNGDVEQLRMSSIGESVEDVYTRDVIDSVFGISDIYESFEAYLESEKTRGVISDWESFAYDWRFGVDHIVENGTTYESGNRSLIETVETLAQTNNSRVTIIAHSNGGLLAKALISKLETRNKAHLIDRVIFIASPQLGTPKAVGAVLHGYDQERVGGLIVDDATAREVIQNFPGAYGLIPSAAYFDKIDYPMVSFESASSTQSFVDAYGMTIDSPEELADFMRGEQDGRGDPGSRINEPAKVNGNMYGAAQQLHEVLLDSWVAPETIDVIEIVGVGLDTVKGFVYKEFIERTCIPAGGSVACAFDPYYEPVPQFTQYGDETVVSFSAEAYPGEKRTYYIDLLQVKNDEDLPAIAHVNITNLVPLHQFVSDLIQDVVPVTQFLYDTEPVFSTEREVISTHSPVTLSLTDALGNSVGKTGVGEDAQIFTNIPGSSYTEFAGGTYIIVPSNVDYTAHIKGTREGSYTLTRELIRGEDAPILLSELSAATVTSDMKAEFSKVNGEVGDVRSDYDGDGVVDETITIDGEPTTGQLFGVLHSMVLEFSLLKKNERDWLLNALSKAKATGERKGYDSGAVARVFSQVDSRLMQYMGQGKITVGTYNVFTDIVFEIKTR